MLHLQRARHSEDLIHRHEYLMKIHYTGSLGSLLKEITFEVPVKQFKF